MHKITYNINGNVMETSNIPIMTEISNFKKSLKSDKNIYSEKFSEINNLLLY